MAKFKGFKIICTKCGNEEQDLIECIGDYDGITHITCRVCDHKAVDKKYSWQED
jgi:hypothetical protein